MREPSALMRYPPLTPPLASAYPSLLGTPGLGTSAFHSLYPRPQARDELGEWGARAGAPTESTGPAGPA